MSYTLQIIDNPSDLTFNQLLAINDEGQIAGYYGSGAVGHPNKGYTVTLSAGKPVFVHENYPTSAQTQVTGINNGGLTVGFEIDAAGDSYGFLDNNGVYSIAVDPSAPTIGGVVSEQFLGVNDSGWVAGFYVTDAAGDTAGFYYNDQNGVFYNVAISGATSITATDINDQKEISGFYTAGGKTEGFLDYGGKITVLAGLYGWSDIQALGLNDAGLVVGSYVNSKGDTDGFVYNRLSGVYTTISEGAGTETVVNGVNNEGQLVGFYVDKSGNTDGMLLTPPATAYLWQTRTIDNSADPTFNQLLAINNAGEIAGYYGSGAVGHPNKGYVVLNDTKFVSENYPGSTQTQVTGVNNGGVTVGFEVDAAGNSVGFVDRNGVWQAALDPYAPTIGGVVSEQFLGVNDRNQVAGFYIKDASDDAVGFIYNDVTGAFSNVAISGATSVTATDVNDEGYISGFYTTAGGKTEGFIDEGGHILSIPGGYGDSNVQVLGLNNTGLAVGSYETSKGATDGFIYSLINGDFQSFTAPSAVGQTVLNGVNDLDQIAGFYMDKSGNTHGLLVTNA